MNLFVDLVKLLPPEKDLFSYISKTIFSDDILKKTFKQINELLNNPIKKSEIDEGNIKSSLEMLNVLIDWFHENLHIGEWHSIDIKLRRSYSVACYFKVKARSYFQLRILQLNFHTYQVLLLIHTSKDLETLNECIYIFDLAIILGDRIKSSQTNKDSETEEVLQQAALLLSKQIADLTLPNTNELEINLKIHDDYDSNAICDIDRRDCPSIEYFLERHFNPQKPLLITNAISHWPAIEKWRNYKYLIAKAGSRTVPIELGSKYTSDNWSQSLVKFSSFLEHCLVDIENKSDQSGDDVAYLAQHDLFDQIPELRNDICVPEYICSSENVPRIKAWLGPKGTISPLHTDPTHNLLCQIFGKKKVILAAPENTDSLYPYEHFILHNTSQIDAESVDYNKFPLVRAVKFYELLLQKGDMLYLPPKWWHYVRSQSPSFSVSFWFD